MLAAAAASAVLSGCAEPDGSYRWNLPEGYPPPVVPADNPMSAAKVELGRRLFYDGRLSVTGDFACASCHRQALSFTDGRDTAIGATGQRHPRGSMSLLNVAYASRLTWANPLLSRLEFQALTPLFGESPIEMGMAGREREIVELLRNDENYREAFPAAFPGDSDPYSVLNAVRAIASFVRSIVSYDAPYDRYLAGDEGALSPSQVRGMELFFSERLECFHCHGGINFTDSSTHARAAVDTFGFHNTGLYNIGGSGAYPADNTGLYDFTGERRDMGRFRAPSLRNVTLTAPYMHDGSIPTLDAVIDHYAAGGRQVDDEGLQGDGSKSPYKSAFVPGFDISPPERGDLLAFLEALADRSILTDPRLADPNAPRTGADRGR